ncbi:plasmid replication protein RepC [Rhizobium sp. S152]|uniref:plasmid replication protein RepC n=1 Tax=Rhizobium sp. S152 TaxID=3055038 RepID=UPI0025A9F60F|nr:plasmid replication protein RepC [Rhizobium sp. S152]MDM9628001.1 plasmid replication protein RepC [Rhizobium sp. S152]
MESGLVTTPFGRRPVTLGMLASQVSSKNIKTNKTVDKWKLYRALCEAKPMLAINDRALAVLNALLSFYPKNELAEEHGLVVFPSNHQLSLRSHGMAEQTIRRHIATLVDAGLLIRKDSPNGKRYARRDRSGDINEAFGFSLAPLLARADEIEHLAAEVVARKLHIQSLRERISLCRRDITKLIDFARQEDADDRWEQVHDHFRSMIDGIPRSPTSLHLQSALDKLTVLREKIVKQLETRIKTEETSANPYQNERHIQNTESESISESERLEIVATKPAMMTIKREECLETSSSLAECTQAQQPDVKSFPLSLVLQACPDISAYHRVGRIENWRDLMITAVTVRTMLGISPSAYQDACAAMGAEGAAVAVACILERGASINSAGGYLRDLTARARRGEFSLGPMLMALVRQHMQAHHSDQAHSYTALADG